MKKKGTMKKTAMMLLLVIAVAFTTLAVAAPQEAQAASTKRKISASSATLVTGTTKTLTVQKRTKHKGKDKKYHYKWVTDKKKTTWSTSNKSVATVSSKGTVTAKKNGKAVISAKVSGKTYKCTVTVVTRKLSASSKTVNAGKSCTLSMQRKSGSKYVTDSVKTTWRTSNKSVAYVSSTGKVTGLKAGKATITAKAGTKSYKCTVTVNPVRKLNSTAFTINPGEKYRLKVLTAVYTMKSGKLSGKWADETAKVSWSADGSSIAVSGTGLVTAKAGGMATVKATVGGKTYKCNLSVNTPAEDVENPDIPDIPDIPDDNSQWWENLKKKHVLTSNDGKKWCYIWEISNPFEFVNLGYFDKTKIDGVEYAETKAGTTLEMNINVETGKVIEEDNKVSAVAGVKTTMKPSELREYGINVLLDGKDMPDTVTFTPGKHTASIEGTTADAKRILENYLETPTMDLTFHYSDQDIIRYRDTTGCPPEKKQLWDKIFQVTDEIIKDGMTERDKVKAIHDWIVKNCKYSYEAVNVTIDNGNVIPKEWWFAFDCEGVLLKGEAVCSGYAEAFYWMASAVGLHTRRVDGIAGIGTDWDGHAWNQVFVDGKWYFIDCTWDDYDFADAEYVDYKYFLSEEIWDNHKIDEIYSIWDNHKIDEIYSIWTGE